VKLRKEVKAGLVVVVAVGLLVYGFNFLKGRDIFSTSLDLYARYKNIDGLTANNTVNINGFKIGTVRDIKLDPASNELIVHFIITDNDVKITKGSKAQIGSDGLLGNKALSIFIKSGAPEVEDGDTLVGDIEGSLKDAVNEQILPLKAKLESLVSSVDSVVTVFQTILNKEAREDLIASFASIRESLRNFEHTSQTLDTMVTAERKTFSQILANINSISSNLAANNEPLTKAINNFANISDSLSKANLKGTIDNANLSLSKVAEVMDKINRGEGSMGMLVNDKKLYNDLDKATKDLDELIIDIKKYPGRYLSIFRKKDRPKKNQPPQPGSN
jgi:phospholipid/cholesterol/gamma-HCH transport system substrate-binding protein